MNERFKNVNALMWEDLQAKVLPSERLHVELTETPDAGYSIVLNVQEAKALRDWLSSALPIGVKHG
jgi:hypothetical protein